MNVIKNHLGVETLGMFLETLHQLGALHTHGISRPVIDIGCRHQLTALLKAGDNDRIQIGAGRINRRRITGRAGTEN